MATLPIFEDLGISLLLGLLVGLQRQHVQSPLGGIRTFPLVTVFGTVCALLAATYGGWVVGIGLMGVVATAVVGKVTNPDQGDDHTGLTTAVAMPLMYAVGAYLVNGDWSVAVAVGGTVAILLEMKLQLHGIVARLGDADIKAIMQFVLISFIILPVLPNQTYGWYDVLNPREIWWMVVLVVAMSLGGYIVWKFFGQHAGTVLGGILGGTISSTATAVSFARRSRLAPSSVRAASTVIMISTTVSFVRVAIEMAVVGHVAMLKAVVPLAVLIVSGLFLCLFEWLGSRKEAEAISQQTNPTALKSALVFGTLYAIILFAVAATKVHFERTGLFVVAALSGLTDMDAITLSTSRMVSAGRLTADTGWKVIISAVMANLIFKAALVAMLGDRKLFIRVAILFGILIIVGGVLIAVFP
ncbi:MAG: MgtC/SapB family protein [Planctomycetota bacterium]|nr:MAG: MgtC/SapB family protein [Planctomycetota bacterium]